MDVKEVLQSIIREDNKFLKEQEECMLAYSDYENNVNKMHIEFYKKLQMNLMKKALKDVLYMRYKNHFNLIIEKGELDEYLPDLKKMREVSDEKFKSDFIFITINPKPSILLNDFLKVCNKSINKPWIKDYLYVIEQRGEDRDNLGKGFHLHLLINKGDYRFSHARREFVSTFNKYTDTSNISTFNFAMCKDSDLGNRQNYMIGRKKDESKWLKQDMDKIWRKIYNIPDYYGKLFIENL